MNGCPEKPKRKLDRLLMLGRCQSEDFEILTIGEVLEDVAKHAGLTLQQILDSKFRLETVKDSDRYWLAIYGDETETDEEYQGRVEKYESDMWSYVQRRIINHSFSLEQIENDGREVQDLAQSVFGRKVNLRYPHKPYESE